MDTLRPLAVCGLVSSSWLLSRSLPRSFALGGRPIDPSRPSSLTVAERPAHAFTVVLASTAVLLLLASRLLARIRNNPTSSPVAYTALPLEDISSDDTSRSASPSRYQAPSRSGRLGLRLAFVFLVVATCLRFEVARRVVKDIQCAGASYTMMLPLLVAILDLWTVQRHRSSPAREHIGQSMYDVAEQFWGANKFRYVMAAAVLSFSSMAVLHLYGNAGSTYICPAVTGTRHSLPIVHRLSLLLDFAIAYSLHHLLHAHASPTKSSLGRGVGVVGWTCLISSILMCAAGIAYYALESDAREWMVSIPTGFVWAVVELNVLCGALALSACFLIYDSGIMISTTILTFTVTCAIAMEQSWQTLTPFPPAPEGSALIFFCCAILGFMVILLTHAMPDQHRQHQTTPLSGLPILLYGSLLILFIFRCSLWIAHHSTVKYHPIDMLIYDAKAKHDAYLSRASLSRNLPAAVEVYKERYQRHPPPAFDAWYNFARARDALIIDDFDRVYADLLPFWAMSPAEIRERTWMAISNPWNDVAGISIRNGKADISPNVMPTHRWMLDGILEMMSHFSEFLPDMDIGFNLNDECRVAVPYEEIKAKREVGRRGGDLSRRPENAFSSARAGSWKGIPPEPNPARSFREMSFQRTFAEFGSAGCEPSSAARSQFHWDSGRLCTSCSSPHSLGGFLANWTLSGDVCHQPDVANLHGLYLSPAAFKASHELFPVFSQSKVSGYNDILYPSAWNYMDKVKYNPNADNADPPFSRKKKTLFWRGATSEGVSPGSGTWKGMGRQRFVHMANKFKQSNAAQPVLLPYPIAPRRGLYRYTTLTSAELTKHLSVDVHLVDSIARCGGRDCADQAREFAPLVAPSDFQAHWSYKYLLDLDGAGFSGRFLPFLASRSLPFKAALFREWYDSRLTPWLHFVPLDLRGHGFWATLLYFMGIEGRFHGQNVGVPPHEKEAEMIAEKGRRWAGDVLRKQDMEIYFFRLLLEWGRLTDDRRDEIGYDWKA
ncbi:hypothetical protein MBLNU459_g7419t1 [Dothideomycetes sp. NU459]